MIIRIKRNRRGDPEHDHHLDRDGDGIGSE